MKQITKWFSGFFVLILMLTAISTNNTHAAGTSKLPVFYKDSGNLEEDGHTYIGPSGTVYQIINWTKINAISSSGKKLWTFTAPSNSTLVTDEIVEKNGNLYLGYDDGSNSKNNGSYLLSINAKGKVNWKFKFPGESRSSGPGKLLFDSNGTIYFGTGNYTGAVGPYSESKYYAVTSKGTLKWSLKLTGDGFYSTPFFNGSSNIVITTLGDEDGTQYVISKAGKVLSKKNTTSFWAYTDKAYNVYSLDYASNKLIAKNKSGKQIWSYTVGEEAEIGHVSSTGTVYVVKGDYTLAVSNGKVKWKTKAAGAITSGALGLYVIDWDWNTESTFIKVLDEKTGKIKYAKTLNDLYICEVHPKGFVLASKGAAIYKISIK